MVLLSIRLRVLSTSLYSLLKYIRNLTQKVTMAAEYDNTEREHIASSNPTGKSCSCIFCSLLKDDNDISLIKRFDYGSLYVNYNQFYAGRVMYIYHRHATDITSLDDCHLYTVEKEILLISRIVKKLFKPDLINIATLGNEVPHLHWHIIPRYKHDRTWGRPPWPHPKSPANASELAMIRDKFTRELANE